ncbi:dystrophin [Hyposmocoma kahamanoa]|uniref:dystrophin n=1 Tax=Hyposmocoma kahamanoa TaxID=1477025 RepID=UPI000E6D8126|nr:dystrophin [Hyposmocoma kahamanoa]
MAVNGWKKVENDEGYPCYVHETTGKEQFDHPHFEKIIKSLEEYNGIKHSSYRIAFKIFALQRELRVPPLRIASGVFARHQLSLSETSLSLDTVELEAVLTDIYFAAEKEGLFYGDIDLTVDLLINLLLNVFDRNRKEQIRVLATKTLLIILSEESVSDKWSAMANCCSDHNGCVSPRRLTALLAHVTALPTYLGGQIESIQADVDACFDKNAGMLGIGASALAEWGVQSCVSARFLIVVQRVISSRNCSNVSSSCAACAQPLIQVLKFKCSKCDETYFCEKCYLYDKQPTTVRGHKKSHLVHEMVDGETQPSQCLSLVKTMKRFFFCTKTKKKIVKNSNKVSDKETMKKRKECRPAIFTSTVGKASGHNSNLPSILQDIITQMESQNKALKELSAQLDNLKNCDGVLKRKVDAHFNQVSMQINRLKIVKENLVSTPSAMSEATKQEKCDRPQAFGLFSPIPIEEKQSQVTDKAQPRVLSLDSGNFSVTSKHDNLLTISGDALKPVVVHATSDSISTVSMRDISSWHNETDALAPDKHPSKLDCASQSICATEQKYAADNRSVETSNDKMKELNADLDTVLDRLQQILTNNFAVDDSCFDNTQLRETANEMEGLLGTLIRGVEQRATLNAIKGLV